MLTDRKFNRDGIFISSLLVLWVIIQILINTFIYVDDMVLRCIHIIFLVLFANLLYGNEKKYIKLLFVAISIFVFGYVICNYSLISERGGYTNKIDLIIATLGFIVIIVTGLKTNKNLTLLALFFVSYLYWGKFITGPLSHSGFSYKRVLNFMFWGTQGIFGIGVGVSATYIFLFVLFGSFLKHSGFSNFINDFSLALVGKSPGGPAKVAVIASAFMGMINGSAIANVATTGTITIPMMKQCGYDKNFAAAVEAASSTGGQFCPPIMGAAAFVMAEFLQIPYSKVMISAILPAFLYYFMLIFSVHLEAKKLGLKSADEEVILSKVLRERVYLFAPIIVLLIMMAIGYSPIECAVFSIFVTIVVSSIKSATRMDLQKIVEAAKEGALSAINVGIACVLIGLIIGSVSLSGLGLNFGNLILKIVKDTNLYMGSFMVMVMSVILGMGVPGVAAYVIVVSVAVPIMISLGANPISAHLFCLVYACLSNITPPVAISSYVASSIAKSDMVKTSLIAVKLGISGFIIPFFFINNDVLLLQTNDLLLTIRVVIGAIIGIGAIAASAEGYFYRKMKIYTRITLFILGILLIDVGIYSDIIGIIGILVIYYWERRFRD
ncbi:TRAP transporter fused permease subunit [Peptoniphilus sp. oral taxon 386]|uniref:TRAP transporter permease n=1 Tax=Peptoniphilus sp. oral taxon 386 TaxID=652713 RepID=UPI0001DA99E6|nr:TRAP transporter fused permease subunit [Peptoniphilus sp. oral taxon 386]EFI41792.1 TRAP transporter, 4TM/12TM fusion protein [Peptoniphilus sp. oral taxon 386 str. F0131]